MIYQFTTNFNQMVGAFGSILSNPGAMLDAIIQGSIDTVDSFTPTSWKQQWAPCTPSDTLNLTVAFFQNPFVSLTDSRRLQLCAAFVVGTGIGMVLGMVLTGGMTMFSVLGKARMLLASASSGRRSRGRPPPRRTRGRWQAMRPR